MVVDQNCLKMDLDFKHLKKIKSSWIKHFLYASYFNFLALLIFITGFIHSIIPWVFAFTPYKLAKKIVNETEKQFRSNFKKRN
tara:strand:- start:1115 stop:1363 length:249 start_codon:yes stop_codon:yes gene_type:complete